MHLGITSWVKVFTGWGFSCRDPSRVSSSPRAGGQRRSAHPSGLDVTSRCWPRTCRDRCVHPRLAAHLINLRYRVRRSWGLNNTLTTRPSCSSPGRGAPIASASLRLRAFYLRGLAPYCAARAGRGLNCRYRSTWARARPDRDLEPGHRPFAADPRREHLDDRPATRPM